MSAEFPKIEYTTERREALERRLPEALMDAAALVLRREVKYRFLKYEQVGDPVVYDELTLLNSLQTDKVAEWLTGEIRQKNALEAVALLDLGEAEYAERILDFSRDLERMEEDTEEAEGVERTIQLDRSKLERAALLRDGLIEEVPELRQFATREDFLKWVESEKSSHEKHFKSGLVPESLDFYRERIAVLEHVLAGEPLSESDLDVLNDQIELQMNGVRTLASHQLSNYLIGRNYSRRILLECEVRILELRQFLSNIHGREWVKIKKK